MIRYENGVVMAAYCCQKLIQNDSDQVEAMALKVSLHFGKDLLFLNLIAEDSLSAIGMDRAVKKASNG